MMKGQPLAYNRDMQEDKRYIFFAYDQVTACLTMAAAIVLTAEIRPQQIASRLDEGFADATVFAEYLVRKGVPFRTAHHIVGTLVAQCDKKGYLSLTKLSLEDFRVQCDKIDTDVYDCLGAARVIKNYQSHGAGGIKQLATQIKKWEKVLK